LKQCIPLHKNYGGAAAKKLEGLERLDYDFGTVEKLTLSGADRRINMFLMKISYSQGARN